MTAGKYRKGIVGVFKGLNNMSITVKRNRITLEEDCLDIHLSVELREVLINLSKRGKRNILLDISKVERISTPAIQVLLSAMNVFGKFRFDGLQPDIREIFTLIGCVNDGQ